MTCRSWSSGVPHRSNAFRYAVAGLGEDHTRVARCAQLIWRLSAGTGGKAAAARHALKEKVWLGTYHTPINAAVHHDLYKVVLAIEGCVYTGGGAGAAKKKTHKLKLNFGLDELPELILSAVRFSQLWNKHKQDAERYIFRALAPEAVRDLVVALLREHGGALQQHVAHADAVRRRRCCRCRKRRRLGVPGLDCTPCLVIPACVAGRTLVHALLPACVVPMSPRARRMWSPPRNHRGPVGTGGHGRHR